MLDLKDVFFFVQVVDHGGFTSAGEVLGLQKSTLSYRIKELETSLNVRLINRTSRQFSMTEVGAEFYRHAIGLLRGAELAERAMRERLTEPSGVIRITAPAEMAQYLSRDVLPPFLRRHPKVTIEENATDRLVDIVGEGFDLAIRGHSTQLKDSNLVQRPVANAPWFLFAGPDYLERMPPVERPEQLECHSIISMARKGPAQWHMRGPSREVVTVPIVPRLLSNTLISVKEAACANLGIAALPGYICRAELREGALRQVLPEWIAVDARFSALLPNRNGVLPAVRSLVDFLAEELPKLTLFGDGKNRS
jgi:DNA-binding transcriptional LysR family regulator